MKLKTLCPKCSKPTSLKSDLFGFKSLACGCLVSDFSVAETVTIDPSDLKSVDGTMDSYQYQKEGVKFFYESLDGVARKQRRILIGDDTGLGKTVQAALALKEDLKGNCPALIAVRPSTFTQWFRQLKTWFSDEMTGVYPVNGTLLLPGFQIYLVSMDSLRTLVDFPTDESEIKEVTLKPAFKRSVEALGGFKTLVFDECHSIKGPSSSRTRATLTILSECGPRPTAMSDKGVLDIGSVNPSLYKDAPQAPGDASLTKLTSHSYYDKNTLKQKEVLVIEKPPASPIPNVIMMSATAIKNTAGEYFTALNILAPELFPSKYKFEYDWLDYGGKFLKSYRQEEFHALTAGFIIRRKKEDVLPDLPRLRRDFTFITISDERIKKLYNDEIKKMRETMEQGGSTASIQIHLMTMRRIIGIAKAMFAADVIASDPESLPDKYCIGIHHYDASSVLYAALKEINPLIYDGQTSKDQKDSVISEFIQRPKALLILSMSAGGVGVDGLQCCSEILGVERMWSAADESQFEGRFVRIGSTASHVRAEYYVVQKTIDEFFHGLVEEKRKIFGSVIDGEDPFENESVMKRAAAYAIDNRL